MDLEGAYLLLKICYYPPLAGDYLIEELHLPRINGRKRLRDLPELFPESGIDRRILGRWRSRASRPGVSFGWCLGNVLASRGHDSVWLGYGDGEQCLPPLIFILLVASVPNSREPRPYLEAPRPRRVSPCIWAPAGTDGSLPTVEKKLIGDINPMPGICSS